MGGKARVELELADEEAALETLLSSFQRREASAATLDGLNLSAVDTAKMLLARLQEKEREDLAQRLTDALGDMPPKLLELPAYESGPPEDDPMRPPWRRRWQRRR